MHANSLTDLGNVDSGRLHASCVAFDGRGLMIIGPSGSGKSALALKLMALGAQLVADDQVDLRAEGGEIRAEAPASISGLIEARGIGLLRADPVRSVPLHYIVDFGQEERSRLPEPTDVRLLGQKLTLLRAGGVPNLEYALVQLIKMGRVDTQWPNT